MIWIHVVAEVENKRMMMMMKEVEMKLEEGERRKGMG